MSDKETATETEVLSSSVCKAETRKEQKLLMFIFLIENYSASTLKQYVFPFLLS